LIKGKAISLREIPCVEAGLDLLKTERAQMERGREAGSIPAWRIGVKGFDTPIMAMLEVSLF